MNFYSLKNLTDKNLVASVPWEFKPAEQPSEKVCHDKQERQNWYRSKSTDWNFYSAVEGANNTQRVSKDNPPKFINAFVADYDLPITEERINEAIESMPVKPAYVERSLGGNCRLVWLFPRPLPVETSDFAAFILQKAKQWLKLDLLPGLDEGAFEDSTRLYCNGGGNNWRKVGDVLHESKLQAFYVDCAKEFKFKAPEGNAIPLPVVEAAIKKQFPNFSWPSDFTLDSQGPSFWIPESVSPLSAIVKAEGMVTYSAHAAKPFYNWADILGAEFVKTFNEEAISKATLDIFHDGHSYWRIIDGVYQTVNDRALGIYFREACGIPKAKVDSVLHHVNENARVTGAAPFIFRSPGVIVFNNKKTLNTWKNTVMQPSSSPVPENLWVLDFIRAFFETEEQFNSAMAWLQYFYLSAYELLPRPGQNIFLMGLANRGKTFFSREIVGRIVGGFVDASQYLVRGTAFGSENFHVPVWCIDDETPNGSPGQHDRFSAMMKKAAANQQHLYNQKYEVPTLVEWMGRIIVTANLDYVSSRILGSLDNTSADKTSVFRCTREKIAFPERYELQKMLATELPLFCRWLLNWVVPDSVVRDGRYGYVPHHDQALLEQSQQTSKSATLKELLVESMTQYFTDNPTQTEWRGTLTHLIRLLQMMPLNDFALRSMKMEAINRALELIQREGIIKIRTESGDAKTRIWIISKL